MCSVEVHSSMRGGQLVLDGAVAHRFPAGVRAMLSVNADDALTCVRLLETTPLTSEQ